MCALHTHGKGVTETFVAVSKYCGICRMLSHVLDSFVEGTELES